MVDEVHLTGSNQVGNRRKNLKELQNNFEKKKWKKVFDINAAIQKKHILNGVINDTVYDKKNAFCGALWVPFLGKCLFEINDDLNRLKVRV